MPKKFKGENTKAAAAKAKKDEVRYAEAARKEKEKEDEYWRDDDKHVAKKLQRKDDKEKKRLEQLERKKELQKLHDEEMESIKTKKATADKITRAQIAQAAEQQRLEATAAAEKQKEASHLDVPLEENLNRLQIDGEARTVDAAISVLKDKEPEIDRHPEKRMKAAYKKFEDSNLPIVKQENPGMKLSQLKHMLWKDWMKSPENPLNQKQAES